jgi:hypothetical protein
MRKVSVFVAVLCYSRLIYIEFTLSQRKAEFYRSLVHALEFFDGSPRALIVENLKAAVINSSGCAACFHPEFLALCGYYCLQPIAYERRDPESKGIVEGGGVTSSTTPQPGVVTSWFALMITLVWHVAGATRSPISGSTIPGASSL